VVQDMIILQTFAILDIENPVVIVIIVVALGNLYACQHLPCEKGAVAEGTFLCIFKCSRTSVALLQGIGKIRFVYLTIGIIGDIRFCREFLRFGNTVVLRIGR